MGVGGGFIRRFSQPQDPSVYAQIEGVNILDLAQPVAFQGVTTGVVGLVGEFADMTAACLVDAVGKVQSALNPVAITSPADQAAKLGPPDWTLGAFGTEQGNGFVELRSKAYSALVVQPVDLLRPTVSVDSAAIGDQWGVRLWRHLPTNVSATVPQPVVPVLGVTVAAGYQFGTPGTNRVCLAAPVTFYADQPRTTGTDGTVVHAGAPAATQPFTAAGENFLTSGVLVGDALVMGVIGAGGAQGANAATYRVQAVTDAHTLQLENLDGSGFDFTASAAMAFRIYPGRVADSGASQGRPGVWSHPGSYATLARPLDASIAIGTTGTTIAPTVVPPAETATTCDALSGLALAAHPVGNAGHTDALLYDAVVHAPNAGTSAGMTGRYKAAIDALKNDAPPESAINFVLVARKNAALRLYLRQHVLDCSAAGLTRTAMVSPEINVLSRASLLASADPAPAAYADERVDCCWPGVQVYVPEAVGVPLLCADGTTTTDGLLDITSDGVLAAVLSNLAPEFNPGQTDPPIPQVMAPFLGLQRGVGTFSLPDYVAFKAAGVCAPRVDRGTGTLFFQSGITTSLVKTATNDQTRINRRRMADYIEDSLAQLANGFAKNINTQSRQDALLGEYDAFLGGLLSTANPAKQRIAGYSLDDKSGNTPELAAQDIFVIIVAVQTLGTMDSFVLACSIGQTVSITAA